MLELLVKRFDTHCPDLPGHQAADGIIHHGRGNGRAHLEAVRQIGRHIEFAAADVDFELSGFSEGNDPRIEPMDQSAKRKKVKITAGRNIKSVIHIV